MSIRAVVFDRDGVLTFFDVPGAVAFFEPLLPISIWALAERWQRFGAQHGFPGSVEAEQRFFTRFWDEIAGEFHLSSEQACALHDLDYTRFVLPFADAHPALTAVRRRGIKVGVLSNFTLASLDTSLIAAGLAGLVDVACAASVIGASKPAAAAYAAIATALDVQPAECLFFDDEIVCVEGARLIGMHSYLVNRRQPPQQESPQTVSTLLEVIQKLA